MARADRIILVTGAANGIGQAVSEGLAREGARVILSDVNVDGGEAVAAAIEAVGGAGRFLRHDVAIAEDWERVFADIMEREGALTGLVNNAGLVRLGPIVETDIDDWRLMKRVMLDGAYLGIKGAAPLIAQSGGGAIVNVASRHALNGAPNEAAYASIKAALCLLSRCASREWAARQVRINAVLPGPAITSILDNLPDDKRVFFDAEDLKEELGARVPIRRLAAAHEIAAAIQFLLSDAASFVIGAELVVDGGLSA
jgi:NAD(P)-dependent dehydrogenase (short-subunit alcohol dehydrogenase family)